MTRRAYLCRQLLACPAVHRSQCLLSLAAGQLRPAQPGREEGPSHMQCVGHSCRGAGDVARSHAHSRCLVDEDRPLLELRHELLVLLLEVFLHGR